LIVIFPWISTLFFKLLIMNENILTHITWSILGAWYLDIQFLVDLLDKYNLDFYEVLDSVECTYWVDMKLDINMLIYEVLNSIAYKFISENTSLFENESDEFEIYTNYIDSHIYFTSEKIQSEFEKFY